jgi:sugar lactone lactonase YvrE
MRVFKSFERHCARLAAALRAPAIAGITALLLASASAAAQATFIGSQTQLGSAVLADPAGIAADGAGNLYIADTGNDRIVEIAYSASGYAPATPILTGLSSPTGIAADWYGNLYIADTGNNRVVKLPLAASGFGAVFTIASGLNAPAGVAADLTGNVFVADTGNNRVLELPAVGTAFGTPVVIASGLGAPQSVAVDTSHNLFIADTNNNRILKYPYSASGYPTQQVAAYDLHSPIGIAVDTSFNLYVAQAGANSIVEEVWEPGAGRFNGSIFTGSGFVSPRAMAADSHGNLWVVDASASRPWQVVPSPLTFPVVAVNTQGPVLTFSFNLAAGATLGSVGILTQGAPGLDFVDGGASTCIPQTYSVSTVCSVHLQFNPQGPGLRTGAIVLYDASGNILASAYSSGTGSAARIALYPASQTVVATQLSGPSGVAVDGFGNLYIADSGNNRIVEMAASGASYASPRVLPVTKLNSPMGMAIDSTGSLFITSNGNDSIVKLPWTGTAFAAQSKLKVAVYAPSALTFDSVGDLYIADSYDNRIVKLPWTGSAFGWPVDPGSGIRIPMGVAIDNSGNLYLAMPYQNKVMEVPVIAGKYQTVRTIPFNGISFPTSIVFDSSSNLYLLDTGNNRVLMLPWTGSSFGAQVTVASGFNAPIGMAIDSLGNLYVADTGNNQVVRVNLAQPAAANFATTYVGSTSTDSAKVFTLQNTGSQPLSLDAVQYPVDFPERDAASDCANGDVLAAGFGCRFSIDFSPRSPASPASESVSVDIAVTGGSTMQQSIPVSGVALAQIPQTISFTPIANSTYGAPAIPLQASASSGLPVTFQVVSGPAYLTNGGKSVFLNGAGVIVIQANQPGNNEYQSASVTFSFTVNPVVLTVTVGNASATYGSIPTTFGYSITGTVYSQNPMLVITGAPAIAPDTGSTAAVGTHALLATKGTLQAANYTFVFVPGTLTVKKATLKITAAPATFTYGSALPKLGWTATGFVNGDPTTVLTGAPGLATSASAGSRVGTYSITPSIGTLAAANYAFTFVTGIATVTPAPLTVAPSPVSMTYGAAVPVLKSWQALGLVNGDTIASAFTGAPALSTTATSATAPGTASIAIAVGTLAAANYTISLQPGTLTINKATLSVTASSAARTYGQANPAFAYTLTGFLNGDTSAVVTGVPTLTASVTNASPAGQYPIAVAAGTLASSKYTFALANGILTVNPAVLTVTAASAAGTYGSAMPALTFNITGFVNGDSATVVSGVPTLSTTATATSPAGVYPVTAAVGSLAAANYTFTCVPGELTIAKAPAKVTANNQSITVGNAVPTLTYTVTGLVNGDTTASALSGTPTLTTTATSSSAAGSYAITIAAGSMTAKNYALTFVNGTLTIAQSTSTVYNPQPPPKHLAPTRLN